MDKIFSWATTNWEHIVVIGLGNVDNTADADKPISNATQTALNAKQASGNYALGADARFSDARAASDVSAWAKAGSKPSYNATEIGLGNVQNTALSTWAGTSNVTTVGTVTSGTWSATAIADAKIANATTWNAKASTNAPTFTGNVTISNNCVFSTANATHVPCYKSSTKILGSCLALNATNGVCTNCQ